VLLSDFLETSAKAFPCKVALVCQDRRVTFSGVDTHANSLGNALIDDGLRKQDRVAVYLDNSVESVVSIFGTLKAGGIFLVVNPQVKALKLRYILNDCQARVLITDSKHLTDVADIIPRCPDLKSIILTDHEKAPGLDEHVTGPRRASYRAILEQYPSGRPENHCIDIDLASLIYTSGSTGNPKGVMLTHLNMVSAATSIAQYLENTGDDVILDCLPLAFDYGLYQVLMAFKFGGTVVLEKGFVYPQQIIDVVIREKVTGWPLVPTVAAILLRLKKIEEHDFSRLRYITNTAQALPPSHILRLRQVFPHVKIFSMYGLTECKRVSYLPPDEVDRRPASVGKAMPNTQAFIVDDRGNEITEAGRAGELVVRGANVMRGYWNLPDETDRVLRPGPYPGEKVLYTGDLFQKDEEGYLYFLGRKDDIIKTAGERVSPREVENVLCEREDVVEAAVVGVEDELLGQAIKAFVVLVPDATPTEKDVMAFCSKRLEPFMVPKYVDFCRELPKTSTGKVRTKDLVKAKAVDSMAFSRDILRIDCEAETRRICSFIQKQAGDMRRSGAVVGLSGGVDSALCAELCVRALGKDKVLGLVLPERESNPISAEYATKLVRKMGIASETIDITPTIEALGAYENRDKPIRAVFPDYDGRWKSKIVLPADLLSKDALNFFTLKVEDSDGNIRSARLNNENLRGIVAATNAKQRTRMMYLYQCAERDNYLVCGTTNRSEAVQGFFVKYGDGGVDIEPIQHLYKNQVYQLAEHLGVIREIIDRAPSPDTFSFVVTDEEFYFRMPYDKLDLLMYAWENSVPIGEVCAAMDLTEEQVRRAFRDFTSKFNATKHLRTLPPTLDMRA